MKVSNQRMCILDDGQLPPSSPKAIYISLPCSQMIIEPWFLSVHTLFSKTLGVQIFGAVMSFEWCCRMEVSCDRSRYDTCVSSPPSEQRPLQSVRAEQMQRPRS